MHWHGTHGMMSHEVLPFYTDRLSATIRFGVHEDNLDA